MSITLNDNDTTITSGGGQAPLQGASGSGINKSAAASGESSGGDIKVSGDAFGEGSTSTSGNGSTLSGSGSGSGGSGVNASGDGSSDHNSIQYTVSALLQVSAEDGGIQCSDVGQYECVAGIGHQAGDTDTVNVTVSVAIAGRTNRQF